jgi:diguanylate cyclase
MPDTVIQFAPRSARPLSDQADAEYLSQLQDEKRALQARCSDLELEVQQLKQLAFRDGLTGLANRRHFDNALDKEIRRASRTNLPLTLIMCDVDHFKRYNDTFGHSCGDRILRRLSGLLGIFAHRAGDLVARYGGEKFALLLPGTGRLRALEFAERLRLGVRHLRLANCPIQRLRMLSISLGVTTYLSASLCAPADIVEAADAALYRAKHAGRNCIRYQAVEPVLMDCLSEKS